jgi:hypothetical protein
VTEGTKKAERSPSSSAEERTVDGSDGICRTNEGGMHLCTVFSRQGQENEEPVCPTSSLPPPSLWRMTRGKQNWINGPFLLHRPRTPKTSFCLTYLGRVTSRPGRLFNILIPYVPHTTQTFVSLSLSLLTFHFCIRTRKSGRI